MTQTLRGSVTEAVVSTVAGFGINYLANLAILPLFGFTSLTPGKNFVLGLIYTGISLLRGFGMRRFFNSISWGNK